MSALIPLRESAAPNVATAEVFRESYIPLSEKAVRSDGTIGIKLIAPGWGSSGYYSPQILERDTPRVFPPGTQMFWNHDTAFEEAERPEGDLSRLAAVITSSPRYEAAGVDGPGVYADARIFAGYAPVIDDIAENIGLSIRAQGRYMDGEAEGRHGRIVQEITQDPRVGSRVDFVTRPGAGGAIVSIFEAAPGAPQLENPLKKYHFRPTIETYLLEAGRVLSRANETKLKAALEQLTAVLALLGDSDEATESAFRTSRLHEALSNNDIRQVLDDKLKNRFGGRETYVWSRDWSVQDGWIVFEVSTETSTTCYRLGMTATATDVILADDPPTEVRAMTMYVPIRVSESLSGHGNNSTEDAMSEQELKEAQAALAERDKALAESTAALAKMEEQLLLREAREFVTGKLAEADLPDITRLRLAGQLARNPIVADGKLDEAEMTKAVETAVAEAQAEIAAITDTGNGRITGMGGNGNPLIEAAELAESQKRISTALGSLGYAPVKEA
jgi:hypothetical protein